MKKLLLVLACIVLGISLTACTLVSKPNEEPENNAYRTVYAHYLAYSEEKGESALSYEEWLFSIRGDDGLDGKDGTTPHIGENGNWWIGDVDTLVPARGIDGQNGADGKDGHDGIGIVDIKKISSDGLVDTYEITYTDGTKTTFTVTNGTNGTDGKDGVDGVPGKDGQDGVTPTIEISEDGYWIINGVKTEHKAVGTDGNDGIDGENGKDGVDGTDGKDGQDGVTPTIEISEDGYWIINGVKTEYKAIGMDGNDGADGQDGKDGVDGTDGKDGQDGVTPTIEISDDGYWIINGVKTEYKAIGTDGNDGADGENGKDGVTPTIEISNDGYWVINGVKTEYIVDSFDKCEHNYVEFYVLESTCITRKVIMICDICSDLIGTNAEPTEEHTVVDNVCIVCGKTFYSEGLAFTLNSDGVSYSVSGIGTCIDTDILIPPTHEGLPVTQIGTNAFSNCTQLANVTMSANIIFIGQSAFYNCNNLVNVTFGKNSNLTNIEFRAFSNCSNLRTIIIPASVSNLAGQGFCNCSSLESVIFEDNCQLTRINNDMFSGCSNLTYVTFGENSKITSIGGYAFSNCDSLMSFSIPNGVKEIGLCAFSNCDNLTSVTIPASVTQISSQTFTGSPVADFIVDSNNQIYKTIDGNICSKDGKTLIRYAIGKNEELCVIPDGIITISDYAIFGYTTITSAIIPTSVIWISDSAFRECSNLTSITIPDSVMGISDRAFQSCYKLSSITISDSVTSIGNLAFYGCSNLASITIPNSVTNIGDKAFYKCSELTSVTIPDGVIIGENAFLNCNSALYTEFEYGRYIGDASNPYAVLIELTNKNFTTCNIHSDTRVIAYGVFEKCSILTNIEIPISVTSIGKHAFYSCSNLASITIPNSVTNIGDFAFYNCESLTNVIIGNGVTSIGFQMFYNCYNLTSITIPDSVTSIGGSAFYNCESLTNVTIGNGVTSIGSWAFYNCSNLTSVTIGDSVTEIDNEVFDGCSNLTSINISSIYSWCNISFADYDANPLYYAKNLYLNGELVTELVIPNGITEIKDYAFAYCNGLTSVTIPDSVTSIGYSAFYDCDGLTSVTIGNGVTEIGSWTFYDCDNLYRVYYADTENKWNEIRFGSNNSKLTNATRYYYSETEPTDDGNYWHYVDGEIVVWKVED